MTYSNYIISVVTPNWKVSQRSISFFLHWLSGMQGCSSTVPGGRFSDHVRLWRFGRGFALCQIHQTPAISNIQNGWTDLSISDHCFFASSSPNKKRKKKRIGWNIPEKKKKLWKFHEMSLLSGALPVPSMPWSLPFWCSHGGRWRWPQAAAQNSRSRRSNNPCTWILKWDTQTGRTFVNWNRNRISESKLQVVYHWNSIILIRPKRQELACRCDLSKDTSKDTLSEDPVPWEPKNKQQATLPSEVWQQAVDVCFYNFTPAPGRYCAVRTWRQEIQHPGLERTFRQRQGLTADFAAGHHNLLLWLKITKHGPAADMLCVCVYILIWVLYVTYVYICYNRRCS